MLRTIGALCLSLTLAGSALAADFTQPARDPKFIQSARRQDKELAHFYGRMVPAGVSFNHLGGYQVVVHRAGLDRPVILIPVTSLNYSNAEALRSSARASDVVVGALKLNFGMHEPQISPGTLLLVYDGLRVHLRNVHGEDISDFAATLGAVPAGQKIPTAEGAVNSTSSSVGQIGADGTLRIFLQLAEFGDKGAVKKVNEANKVLLEFQIPGLVEDDESPKLQLATPAPAEKGKPKTN